MHEREQSAQRPRARSGIRKWLSDFVNAKLGKLGYAVVRIGNRPPPQAADFEGAAYAYDNLYLLDTYAPWMVDENFLRIWRLSRRNTLTDIHRCYELYQCVSETASIPGDILEVGVWRGGTGAILAAAAARWKPGATVYLCDTFSGVVKAGMFDSDYRGGEHADASQETVALLMHSLGLRNTSILQGVFPDQSSSSLGDTKIALCHIDVDVYASAADIVRWVEPRTSTGSILVFDDYGFSTCKGITRLVNELRTSGAWIYIYNLNKHAILIKR